MRYSQIKRALIEAEIIDEVSMSPTSLERFANSPEAEGMLLGIEFELCVPNANGGDDEGEAEPDYDYNQSADSIDEIINFFREGDYSNLSRQGADRLRSEMFDQYLDWSMEQIINNIDESDLDSRIRDRLEDEVDKGDMADMAHQRWVEDNPDEDPSSDEANEEIRELTLQLIEQDINDMMEEQGNEWQYAYDNAKEEIEEEMRNDSDYDQEAWLNDIGVGDMQDAERHFGLDWPYMTFSNYGQGDRDVDQIADDFTEGTGFQAKGYSGYHSGSRSAQQSEGYFIIEPDGSIDADEGDAGLEFISPAMPLKDGIEMLKKVQAWAKSEGCYTNKSTGLHMNISVPGMDRDKLDFVKLALFMGDQHVLEQFGRTYNSYCNSAMKIVQEKASAPEIADAVLAKMKEHLNTAAGKLIHSGITQKYTSINTKDKYVEFRGPGGDYLDQDLTKLTSTALRLAQSLRIATDDTAYKQEYAKKLYKLIDSGKQGPMDTVKLFTDYAMGKIKKDELITYVQHTQQQRKEKKGQDEQYWVMNKDGTGGKQLVFASSATDAVVKGGKQMGMSRNDSILKLKAELFKREEPSGATVEMSGPIWDSLTSSLQGYLRGLSDPDKTVEKLHAFKDKMANNEYGYNLTNEQLRYVNGLINQELARRQGGTVDGLGTRWRVNSPSGSSVYVDADSPRQAKVKAVELFAREHGINVDANDLEAVESTQGSGAVHAIPQVWRDWVDTMINRSTDDIVEVRRRIDQGEYNSVLTSQQQRDAVIRVIDDELRRRQDQGETGEEQEWSIRDGLGRYVGNINATTQAEALRIYGSVNSVDTRNYTATLTDDNPPHSSMSTTSRELFDSLPEGTRSWLERVGEHHDLELRQALDHIEAGRGIGSGLYSNQVAFVKTAIETELRRRSNNDAVDNDDTTRNPVFDTLPQHWKDFLTNDLSYSADMNLINMLRNLSREDAGRNLTLTDQQLAYIRILLKRQLRANGINPDDETPAEQPADLTSPDDETIDDLMGGGDEEEETPQGVDPEHSEWNIVDTETGDVVSRISGGDIVYAVRSAREQERIRDLPLGRLEPRAANQTNESIDLLRKLAGLV